MTESASGCTLMAKDTKVGTATLNSSRGQAVAFLPAGLATRLRYDRILRLEV